VRQKEDAGGGDRRKMQEEGTGGRYRKRGQWEGRGADELKDLGGSTTETRSIAEEGDGGGDALGQEEVGVGALLDLAQQALEQLPDALEDLMLQAQPRNLIPCNTVVHEERGREGSVNDPLRTAARCTGAPRAPDTAEQSRPLQ